MKLPLSLKIYYFQLENSWLDYTCLEKHSCVDVSSRLQYDTPACQPAASPHFDGAHQSKWNVLLCVDSRRHWPLSRSKHLSEIGWNCYNPGRGLITPAWDRHETPSVFVLPISLGLGVLSSCVFDSFSRFSPPSSYLFGFSGGAGRAPSGDRALIVRTLKKHTDAPHCHANVKTPTRKQRTSYSALAISINPLS